MSKNVLIIGSSAKEYALAKNLSENNNVFVASGSAAIKEFATCVDIREDSVSELLEFVMENDIDITIPVSLKALESNIVEVFNKNGQQIFAPSKETSQLVFDKCTIKKILYKLRIPTPKFGIFEKQNMAFDYIKNIKTPFVIKTNEPSSAVILTSPKSAKIILDSSFAQRNQKVLIEDYVWGTPFSFYIITDGYKALPIGSSIIYKHSLEGEGGQLTSGMGCCAPNYKLSIENEYYIMDNVVYPILEYLESGSNPYLGILGINGILTEDGTIQIIGFQPFMHDCDCSAILEILDADLLNLMESCSIGSFSDEIEYIPQKELSATSVVLVCKNNENKENAIEGLEVLDESVKVDFYHTIRKNRYLEYEAEKGPVLVLTALGRTATSSTEFVYNEVELLNFKGVSYRKDICKPTRVMY